MFFVCKKEKIPKIIVTNWITKRTIQNPIINPVVISILNSGSVGSVINKIKSWMSYHSSYNPIKKRQTGWEC
ncbi:MAG: hypothetical protein AC479_08485 [miscellaneous Crenarchaeota group-6 archaeon AD8-1]|nr:MAG: hypothetical protein AC479_08485 [miscellaneous Crenarchaeota group-6 archaeon AD8-1]